LTAKLGELSATDRAAFAATRPLRDWLGKQYPDLQPALGRAAQGWGARAVAAAVAGLEDLAPADATGYRAGRDLREFLARTFLAEQGRLKSAQDGWAGRHASALLAQTKPLLASDPAGSARRLGRGLAELRDLGFSGGEPAARLIEGRTAAVRAGVEAGRREVYGLIKADRHQAAAQAAGRWAQALGVEARQAKLDGQLSRLAQAARFFAALARRAGVEDER
jgi:hypothetical protein